MDSLSTNCVQTVYGSGYNLWSELHKKSALCTAPVNNLRLPPLPSTAKMSYVTVYPHVFFCNLKCCSFSFTHCPHSLLLLLFIYNKEKA